MSNEIPEPFAHPEILTEPTGAFSAVERRTTQRRLGLSLFIIGFGWVFANASLTTVLLAAKIAILAPDDKVFFLGLATAIAGVSTTIALFIWGAVSDLTRTRLGRRTPWIIVGAVGGSAGLALIALSDSIGGLITAFIGYGLVFNALPAAVLAVLPDRVPRERRGTFSAIYGGSQVIAGAIASIVASRFLDAPNTPLFVAAGVLLVTGLLFVVLAPDHSSKDEPRVKLDIRGLLQSFRFPAGAPDFYWAFAGRFLLLLGLYMVQNFSLYILTDYIGLSTEDAGNVVAISGLASLVTITAGTFVAGPLSDRIKRRKPPIFVASMLFALAVLVPLVWPTAAGMIIFGAVSGLGLGAFLSVDAALMTEVLPSEESRGKDLGILNTANNVPQIVAPLITASIVGIGSGYAPVFVASLVVMVIGAFSIFKIRGVR